MATIEFHGVTKWYQEGLTVVDEVSFEIRDGEFMVVVGPSGCGKSTLLRMIAGLEDISRGELRIDGERVNERAPKDRDIAMVFQNYALYPHMSVFDNMAFGLKLRRMPKPEIRKRVEEAAVILGLMDYLARKPKELSGGQRQRVAVGRAIVRNPKVFLFDEPLSNLDARMRVQTRAEITALHRRLGATMVYVTHDQTEAMTMGDRIVVMDSGRISQIDTPLNLYHHPANVFVAGFIGSPSMNLIPGELNGTPLKFTTEGLTGFVEPFNRMSAGENASSATGRKAILGIRSEDLAITAEGDEGSFPAVVEISEPLGNETYTYARAGERMLVARTSGHIVPEAGSRIGLRPDPGKVHLFDWDTGQSLSARN